MSGNDGNGGRMTGPGRDSPEHFDAGVPTDMLGQDQFIAAVIEDGMLNISDEEYRIYHYADGSTFKINNPTLLPVRRKPGGDSHRIVDTDGHGWYVAAGWVGIEWKNRAGVDPIQF